MGFATPSYTLPDLFARVDRGDLQLPDFQRTYSWDVDRIRSLLVTVLRGYPIGSLMALDTRNEPMRFRPRPLSGAPDTGENPGLLLLDGQQRLTTLYLSLTGDGTVETVDSRSKRITRRFYVDLRRAVQEPVMPDEAVFSVDETGEVQSHFGPVISGGLSHPGAELENFCVPVSALLGEEATDFIFDLIGRAEAPMRQSIKDFYNQLLRPLAGYSVPIIRLARETAQAGIGSIFAQANSAGLQMDVFELLTAVFASEDPDYELNRQWRRTRALLREYPVLDSIGRTEFLTAISLLVTGRHGRAVGHREDILKLTLGDYRRATEDMRIAFQEAAVFLSQRCILTAGQVPYPAQIIPLAVILAILADEPQSLANTHSWDRLHRWFWSGVFGELYGSAAVITRMGYDVDQVSRWVGAGTDEVVDEPKTVRDAEFTESRLLSVNQSSGVWQGIYALLMARGARDWRTAQPFDRWTFKDLDTGFHPIFPRGWCEDRGVDLILADSVLNRTPMGRRTQVMLDGAAPGRYLNRVQEKSLMDDVEFDIVLAGHDLDPALLHASDAEAFFADRRSRLLGVIEYAIGKPVLRDVNEKDLSAGAEGPGAFVD
ncbi:GmrSD restriction endonuclease domain-containing protein [Corynebacterium sp. A21]|uniref:GmrSD restriction endonuclease domain-containing protein n=1 Tax=Corynebacterium sp. A21 TaxID=3457318 RepID=UPI003FD47BF5